MGRREPELLADVLKRSLDRIDRGEPSPHEQAFRRGYLYAYLQAISDAANGHSVAEMREHSGLVEDWRDDGGRDPFPTAPPTIGQPTREA